jgi:hypothetical protein
MPAVFFELDTNNRGPCLGVELMAQEDFRPTGQEARDRTGEPTTSDRQK